MQAVCAKLIAKGRQTLSEVIRMTELPPSLVKQALLVLIQHNCVNCYLYPEEALLTGVKPAYHVYQADVGRILQSIRAPLFLQHVRDRLGDSGEAAEAIVEALLEHGRLRYWQYPLHQHSTHPYVPPVYSPR